MTDSQNHLDRHGDAWADHPTETPRDCAAREVYPSAVGASHDDVLARIPELAEEDVPFDRPTRHRQRHGGQHRRPRTTGSPVGLLAGAGLLLLAIVVVPLVWKNNAAVPNQSAEPGAWEMPPPAPGAPVAPAWNGAGGEVAGYPSAAAPNWQMGTAAPTTVQPEAVAPSMWNQPAGVPDWAAAPTAQSHGSPLPSAGTTTPWPNTTAAAGWSDQPPTGAAAIGPGVPLARDAADHTSQPNWTPRPAYTQPAYGAQVPAEALPPGNQTPAPTGYTGHYRPSEPSEPYANAYHPPQQGIGSAAASTPQPSWSDSSLMGHTPAGAPIGVVPNGTANPNNAYGADRGVQSYQPPSQRDPVSMAQRDRFSPPPAASYDSRTSAANGYYGAGSAGGTPAYQAPYQPYQPYQATPRASGPAATGNTYPSTSYPATPPATNGGYRGTAYPYPSVPPAAGNVPSSGHGAAATAAPGQPGVARLNGVIEKPHYSASHDRARPSFY